MRKLDLNQIFSKENKTLLDVKNKSLTNSPKKLVKNKYFSSPEFMNSPPAENLPIPNFDEE
jgi:hypothetical protein